MTEWWQMHPIIAPLPRGFIDDDRSHKEARDWMNRATDEIEAARNREAKLREALNTAHVALHAYGCVDSALAAIRAALASSPAPAQESENE